MFFNKTEEEKVKTVEAVSCGVCKCLINITDAQDIKTNYGSEYYCQGHRREYESKVYSGFSAPHVKYYKKFEVDENGKLITNKNK